MKLGERRGTRVLGAGCRVHPVTVSSQRVGGPREFDQWGQQRGGATRGRGTYRWREGVGWQRFGAG
eukprot:536617-Hanusia_phi.AAC.1